MSLYLGEPGDSWRSPDTEERARQTVLWVVDQSFQVYSKLRRNMDVWFDRYTNQPLKLRQTNRLRSNVPSGRTSEMVDTFRADMMTKIFKKRPFVAVWPREPGDQDSSAVNEELLQYDYDEMQIWSIVDQVLTSILIWGSGLAKVGWTNKTVREPLDGVSGKNGRAETVERLGYRGPSIDPAFPYDVFPHPMKVWCDDPYPIVHVTHQSYDDLYSLYEADVYTDAVKRIPEKKDVDNDYRACFGPASEDLYERYDQRQRLGWSDDTRLESDGVTVAECECMFRPTLKDRPVRTIITLANGVVIRVEPSPLRDGSSCWMNGKMAHFMGQFYGPSMVQKNKPQIHIEELALNMWLQSIGQTVNKIKVIRPELLEAPMSFDDQPGGIIAAKPGADINQVYREIVTSPVGNDVIMMMKYAADRSEGVSGATDLKSGRIPGGDPTATASNQAFTQASIRFRYGMEWFGATFCVPSARKMHAYNQDYLDPPFVFSVLGKQGAYFPKVSPEDLLINPNFIFMGPTRDENEALQIAQLSQYLNMLAPFQALPWALPVMQEVMILLADKFNIPNLDKLKELMQYGQPPAPPMAPPAAPGSGGMAGSAPQSPAGSGRADRRGNGASNMQELAKSVGGMLAGRAMGR